jgi:hypothetical protein
MHTASAFIDDRKNAIVMDEDNITFFPLHRMQQVEMDGGRISAVIAENVASGKRLRFEGGHFADCTGDGCVGYLAGADFEISARAWSGCSSGTSWWKHLPESDSRSPRASAEIAVDGTQAEYGGGGGVATKGSWRR